ncbi:MAG: DUF3426 domain-containing protein [Desulfobacterales bacterium]|jgi:predicted Zn finger-like uncharacterized protein
MIVTCNECESSFNVDDSLIKADGSKVRCSKCSSVFVVYPDTSDSEMGEDADDFSFEMDEDLGADLDSDEEIDDFAIEDSADDELPELDDMMDFDDDEPAAVEADEEASGELGLDFDLDEDEDMGIGETGALDEEEPDFDLEAESVAEADEFELDHVDSVDSDLPDMQMDLDDLDQTEEADMVAEEADLDLDLEPDDEKAAATAAEAVAADDGADALDLSDLEDLVGSDEDMDLADVSVEASDDAGMDLELDAEEMEPTAAEAVAADDGADALDLSDLEDLVGSDAETELEAEAVEALDDTDLDLSDLDNILDDEEEPAQADLSAEGSDDLDLDLEAEASDDLDLDLDLEAEPTTEEPILESSEDLEGADELDLSDLDGLMESDETPAETAPIEEVGEDLELDFEVDEGAAETAALETAETPDQLDMPDLEKMLESDETPTSEGTEDLDLDLDLDLETEGEVEASASPAEQPPSDDAEFLDIEKILEESEDTALAESGAEETLELDLEAVMDEAAQPKEPELELNLDLGDDMLETESALDISEPAEDDLEFNLLGSDEETLQFGATQASATQIDEGLAGETDLDASDDDFASDNFAATQELQGDTDIIDQLGAGISAPVKKKRSRKPVLVALLVLVLCLAGYIVTQSLGIKIPYVSDLKIPYLSDVKIPYLSGLLKSEDQDISGNLKITPMGKTITHKFIENTSAGDIFVIVGQVRNEYDHPRSFIKITGKLYRKGKALAKTATVYGGNMLSDSDLERLDMAAINKRLQNRFGDNRSNIKVKTGKTLPFVLVFSKLPANLDEYTVEVSGSSS